MHEYMWSVKWTRDREKERRSRSTTFLLTSFYVSHSFLFIFLYHQMYTLVIYLFLPRIQVGKRYCIDRREKICTNKNFFLFNSLKWKWQKKSMFHMPKDFWHFVVLLKFIFKLNCYNRVLDNAHTHCCQIKRSKSNDNDQK